MGKSVVFIDTETTSLGRDREAWDVGLIKRSIRTGHEEEHHFYVEVDATAADPKSLEVGRFHERHPAHSLATGTVLTPAAAAAEVARLTRWTVLVGLNPAFDEHHLANLLHQHGIVPAWHYTPVDLKAVMLGRLASAGHLTLDVLAESSDQLAGRCGLGHLVEQQARHTALGDARIARDLFDALSGAEKIQPPAPAPGG